MRRRRGPWSPLRLVVVGVLGGTACLLALFAGTDVGRGAGIGAMASAFVVAEGIWRARAARRSRRPSRPSGRR